MNTAVSLHNQSPTSVLKDKTPFESWFGKKPNVTNLKVFGSVCFVLTPDHLQILFYKDSGIDDTQRNVVKGYTPSTATESSEGKVR